MIIVHVDGATRGHPGPSGAGIFIKSGQQHYEISLPLGIMTNHEAEFHAMDHALDFCLEKFPDEILSFRSDAKVVVDAIEKGYTNHATFKPIFDRIQEKITTFPLFFIKWVPSKDNRRADQLAREAIHHHP